MTKNLFRVNFTNPAEEEKEYADKHESFKETDGLISQHIPVHVFDVPIRCGNYDFLFGRDVMVEWHNALLVKKELFQNPSFIDFMEKIGYQKRILPHDSLSEGGCFVFGKEFLLMSDIFEKHKELFLELLKGSRLDLPIYFMPSLTSEYHNHIDCDYQIIDRLRLVYVNENLNRVNVPKAKKARKTLEEIAKRHDYEIREYKAFDKDYLVTVKEEDMVLDVDGSSVINEGDYYDFFLKMTGINFILNGSRLFTGFVHPEEKEFLQSKGLEAEVVPVGKVNSGAGLRCIYGEFDL